MPLLLPAASRSSTAAGARSWAFREALAWAAAGCCIRSGLGLLLSLPPQGRLQVWKGEEELSISPENCSETDMGPGDHMMRQTPVCPTRQWELPPAFTGTMTSDLKFCFLLAFLRSVGSEQ